MDIPALRQKQDRITKQYAQNPSVENFSAMIEVWLPYAYAIASRYHQGSEAKHDIEQSAAVGLVDAVRKYKAHKGEFIGLAKLRIHGEIKDHFRRDSHPIHIARQLQVKMSKIRRLRDECSTELSVAEFSKRLELSAEDVAEALVAIDTAIPGSLDAPLWDHPRATRAEAIEGLVGSTPDQRMLSIDIQHALNVLLPRRRTLLLLQYVYGFSHAEIAEIVGISRYMVNHEMAEARSQLAELLESYHEINEGSQV